MLPSSFPRRTAIIGLALFCAAAPAALRAQDSAKAVSTQPRVSLPAGTRVTRPAVTVPTVVRPPANIQGGDQQQLVTVPNLAGRSVDEARRLLAAAGLELGRVAEGSGSGTAGTVMQQQPRAGSVVAPRSDVRLWLVPAQVAAGPQEPSALARPPVTRPQAAARATVPRLVGRTVDDARGMIAQANLEVEAVAEVAGNGPLGTVVRQLPQAGTAVAPKSGVRLWVVPARVAQQPRDPAGAPVVRVPSLVGSTVEDARETLSGAGLQVAGLADGPAGRGVPGTVARQEPAAGSAVLPNSGVRLWLVPARRAVVPAIMGLPLDRARAMLRESGLRPGEVAGTGRVIGHTYEAGTSVPAGSVVNISLGVPPAGGVGQVATRPDPPADETPTPPAQRPTPPVQRPTPQDPVVPAPSGPAAQPSVTVDSLAVPDVRRLALGDARAALQAAGLAAAFDASLVDSATWTVSTQQPGPGARVASGGVVALLLDPPAATVAGTTAPVPTVPEGGSGFQPSPATPPATESWVRRNTTLLLIAAVLLLIAAAAAGARRMRVRRQVLPIAGVSARLRMDAPARVAVDGMPFGPGALRLRVKPGRSAVRVAAAGPLFVSKEVPVD
jgi:beta-lactam-binding protein with PASTA domain